jgi:hypothetical protein
MWNLVARLHLKFSEEAFDPRIVELTHRFFDLRKQVRRGDDVLRGRLFDTWLHGACLVYDLPFPALVMDPKARPPHGMMINVGWYEAQGVGTVHLVKWSAISLFHQFRHHMQAHTEDHWDHDRHGQDAQEWACSLFYRTDKKLFRKWVRRGRIAGVYPGDLLKRRKP